MRVKFAHRPIFPKHSRGLFFFIKLLKNEVIFFIYILYIFTYFVLFILISFICLFCFFSCLHLYWLFILDLSNLFSRLLHYYWVFFFPHFLIIFLHPPTLYLPTIFPFLFLSRTMSVFLYLLCFFLCQRFCTLFFF